MTSSAVRLPPQRSVPRANRQAWPGSALNMGATEQSCSGENKTCDTPRRKIFGRAPSAYLAVTTSFRAAQDPRSVLKIAAAMSSGNRSGVHANAGMRRLANARAWSWL